MEIWLLAAAAAVFAGAVAQAVGGLGFVLVCGPALVLVLGPSDGVRAAVTLTLLLNAALLAREYRGVHLRTAGLLLLGAVATVPAWRWAFFHLPADLSARVTGAVVIVGVLALAWGRRWPAAGGRVGALSAGAASSAMNVLAGVGGPPVALYVRNAGWSAVEVRPTLQAYGVVLNLVTLIAIGPLRPSATLAGVLLTAMVAGIAVGTYLAGRAISDHVAQQTTLALAGVGGALLLIGGAG